MAAFVFRLCILFFSSIVVYVRPGYLGSMCNGETAYAEIESHVVLNCPISLDYLAVCWYFKDPQGHPLSCIERGQKTFLDGYDISDEGAIIINEFREDQVGVYFMEIIDLDGKIHYMNVTIDVKVSLTSEPVIVDCSSSMHDVCTRIEEGKRQTTLACIAGPAKPPVSISWSLSDGTKLQSDYSSAKNGSTSLSTSTSLLEYNSADYLLEYFTCGVTGEAVTETVTTGMFMKGNKDTDVQQQAINYVKSGADVTLECPLASGGTLGEWGMEFPNNTYRWLWRKYPGFDGGPCVDADDCDVQAKGNLHLSKVTYINEGRYLCTYAKVVRKFPVDVLVSPEPQKTVIKGCEGKYDCELNVANSGSLECSIFGSRPSINPEVTVDKEFNPDESSEVFIFGEELESEEGSLRGTFNTVLRFEYKIPECSDVVRIKCFAGNNTHSDEIMKTTVHLVTATSGCGQGGGRPGLIVFLVLFFLFLLLIVGIVLYVFKRDYILEKLGKRSRRNPDALEVGYVPTPDNEHKTKFSHQVEHIPVVTNADINEDETTCLQKIFDEKFQPIYKEITGNTAKYEDFNEMMSSFSSEQKVNIPVQYLAGFLKNKSNSNEEVLQVLKFVIEHFNNQWVGYFLKMLDDLLETNQVSATNYITLIGSLVQKRVIGLSRYVELTGAFLSNNTASFDNILATLKNMIDKRYCSREDFSNTFLQYYLGNYITDDDVIKELSAETEAYKFLPPFFLQSAYQEMKEKNETKAMRKLAAIFKKVWDQMMGESLKLEPHHKSSSEDRLDRSVQGKPEEKEDTSKKTTDSERQQQKTQTSINQATDDDKKEELNENERSHLISPNEKEVTIPDNKEDKIKEVRIALIQALLFCVDSEKISMTECGDMIRDMKIPQNEIEESIYSYIGNRLATTEKALMVLKNTLTEKLISDEAYIDLHWLFAISKKEVTFDEFMEHIKKLLEDKLISGNCFEKKVTEFIKGKGMQSNKSKEINYHTNYWNGDQWIKFVTGLVIYRGQDSKKERVRGKKKEDVISEKTIGNSLRLTLFQCVVSTKRMTKDDVKQAMKDEYAIKANERKPLLENVKFA